MNTVQIDQNIKNTATAANLPIICRIFLNFNFLSYTNINKKSPKIGAFCFYYSLIFLTSNTWCIITHFYKLPILAVFVCFKYHFCRTFAVIRY